MVTTKSNVNLSREETLNHDSEFNIWVLFSQTCDTISRARKIELAQYRITSIQASVLFMLLLKGNGVTISEISKWILREPHSVLTLINRMANNGLVQKVKETSDTKVRIILTEKGRQLYTRTTRRSISLSFSVLSDDEKRQLQPILKKLRAKTRKLLGWNYKAPFLP